MMPEESKLTERIQNSNTMVAEKQAKELESIGRQLLDVIRRLNSVVKQIGDSRSDLRNGL